MTPPEQQDILKGGASMGLSFLAVITTYQEQLEYWLRVSGSLVFLVGSCITIYLALRRKRDK